MDPHAIRIILPGWSLNEEATIVSSLKMDTDDELPGCRSYVLAAAAAIELPLAHEYLVAVEEDFSRAHAIAQFLMEFPLDQNIEPAPVFQP